MKHFRRLTIVSLFVLAYLWVCLPTFPHQLCKTCWTAGGDGQPLDTQTHKHVQIQEAEVLLSTENSYRNHLKLKILNTKTTHATKLMQEESTA